MWANEVQNFNDIKKPGDFMRTINQDKNPAGIIIMCICGDAISLSNKVHTFESMNPLTISPSIGHYYNDRKEFKCHYFIKNGELVNG